MESKVINEKSNNTKENIIIAASKLMTIKGVKSTSLADIAKEVGISKGTLYYYYPSKNEIIFDIAEKHINQITNELFAWMDKVDNKATPKEIIKVVFERILTAETRGKLHLYLISNSLTSNEYLKKRFREKYKQWRNMIEEVLKKILIDRTTNYVALASIVLASLDGLTIQWLLGVENLPIDDIATLLADID
jgi:AcrR family transcriptional regulator